MQPYEQIKQYSKTVCEQIRWKKAHGIVSKEIENHICDQRDAYLCAGEDEKSATNKAILQMGDAVAIGMELDKTHKPKPQWFMIALTLALMFIGVLVNYFIDTSEYSLNRFSLVPFIIAAAMFFVAYFLDFSSLAKYPKHCYFSVLGVSMVSLLLSNSINGRAWINLGGASMSLVYLALIFPFAYSLLIYALRGKGYRGILLCGLGYIPFTVILLFVPTFVGALLYTISALILLCNAIAKGWFGIDKKKGLLLVLIPTCCVASIIIFYLMKDAYFWSRLSIAINPYSDQHGRGYIYVVVRELLSSAKFIGKGVVPPQYGADDIAYLGEDYILTAFIHNFGWIVFIGIIVLFTAFSVLGLYHISKQKSVLGYLVSSSIMLTFIIQCVFYISKNLGIWSSALSLPLVSYGGVSLIINSMLIGFMLSVFRTGDVFDDNKKFSINSYKLITLEDGKLIINLRA